MVALAFESRVIISWLLPRQRAVVHLLTQDEPKAREIQVGNDRLCSMARHDIGFRSPQAFLY